MKLADKDTSFNSIKVQVKPLIILGASGRYRFNSIKVQVKHPVSPLVRNAVAFQFHKGTSKTSKPD